jgi:predicted Rdx family selenoprotein
MGVHNADVKGEGGATARGRRIDIKCKVGARGGSTSPATPRDAFGWPLEMAAQGRTPEVAGLTPVPVQATLPIEFARNQGYSLSSSQKERWRDSIFPTRVLGSVARTGEGPAAPLPVSTTAGG